MESQAFLDALELPLFMLAATEEQQVAFLAECDLPVESLASSFVDVMRHAPAMEANGVLDPSQASALRECADLLERMQAESNPALWTPGALGDFGEWLEVRLSARRALMRFL